MRAHQHHHRSCRGLLFLFRGKGELSAKLGEPRKPVAAWKVHNAILVQGHAQARPVCRDAGDQIGNTRARKQRRIGGRLTLLHLLRYGNGDIPRIRGDDADAVLQAVLQQVRADLRIQQVHADAHHGQQQHDGHHRDKNVGDDQPVPQAPEKLIAHPREQAEAEI